MQRDEGVECHQVGRGQVAGGILDQGHVSCHEFCLRREPADLFLLGQLGEGDVLGPRSDALDARRGDRLRAQQEAGETEQVFAIGAFGEGSDRTLGVRKLAVESRRNDHGEPGEWRGEVPAVGAGSSLALGETVLDAGIPGGVMPAAHGFLLAGSIHKCAELYGSKV